MDPTFLSRGSLGDWIHDERKSDHGNGPKFQKRLNIGIDIIFVLDLFHKDCEVPIVHCDLKLDNIFSFR